MLPALWSLPGLVLAGFGALHMRDGAASDAAVPVPSAMVAGITAPAEAYRHTAAVLALADTRNGEAVIVRAEALMHVGDRRGAVPLLVAGLARAPASARGWVLLSEAEDDERPSDAARALAMGLVLAPHDYWLAGRRVRDAARLWSRLDGEGCRLAMDQARLLWRDEVLRDQLRDVLRTAEGLSVVARAFAGQSEDVREMNRWLARRRMRPQSS